MKVVFTLLCVLSLWTLVFIYIRFQVNYTLLQKLRVLPTARQQQHYVNYIQYHVILGPHPDESRSEYLDLLIVVPSGYNRDAAERRSVIRRTWENRSFYPQFSTRCVFVMGWYMPQICLLISSTYVVIERLLSAADPGFPRGGGTNSPGGRQHTILPNFLENCIKSKDFGCPGRGVRPSHPLNPALTVMHNFAGVVENLVQNPQNTLFCAQNTPASPWK